MKKIIANHVYKDYDGVPVLEDVSLEIQKGNFVSIMGESGSGKSTLLHILASLMPPSSGEIRYDDTNIYSLSEKERCALRCRSIGIVYQSFNLITSLSVEDNLLLPIYLQRGDRKEAAEEMHKLAQQMKIENVLDKYPHKISGGQQQRVAILRSLLYHPSVLFLDEPTGNLDQKNSLQIMELLQKIVQENDVTLVQVTHSRATALYGNRILYIEGGKIVDNETVL